MLNIQNTKDQLDTHGPTQPPFGLGSALSPFWQDRLVESGLILSMALYYLVANPNIKVGAISRLNPLFSLPFLLIFAVLCWHRLPFAVALLPLTLPYYLVQKVVISHYAFSLAEVSLWTCIVVALLQILLKHDHWTCMMAELRTRVGPFAIPLLVFILAAALSIGVAYSHIFALRAFREEVLGPLLYLMLALSYLHARQDVKRLLGALLGTALMIALLGIVQYFFFKNTLVLEPDGIRRVHTVYGSGNSIGLLFAYTLPIGLALLMARVSWHARLLALVVCVLLLSVLYLSQSLGAWIGISVAGLFIGAFSVGNRKILLIGSVVTVVALTLVLIFFHKSILDVIVMHHESRHGVSTFTKRIYLWQSALNMIHDSPWLGYGMDNWLCHYSQNSICNSHLHHYWFKFDPVTHALTGLYDEPTLAHPHNIFLHIWVSMGIFAMLAFSIILILFYWLFGRILRHLRTVKMKGDEQLRWMTVGVGAAMLAALIQGQVDSAFLEQDLAFCFWMLVTALLLLRILVGVGWQDQAKMSDVHPKTGILLP